MKKTLALLILMAPFLLLFGCGGGGGSAPTASSGGSTGGVGDVGTGGTANLGTFTFYVPDEVTSNALVDLTGEVSNGVRVAVRKYETTYRNIIIPVCSDAVPQLCDTTAPDYPPTADDPRCTECFTPGTTCVTNTYHTEQTIIQVCLDQVPQLCDTTAPDYPPTAADPRCTPCSPAGATCVTNTQYRPLGDDTWRCVQVTEGPEPVCVDVDEGPDLTRPINTLTYKGINDTLLNSSGGGPVSVMIPASTGPDDLYIFDAVRYVAGDLLWASGTPLTATTPETHCSFIGKLTENADCRAASTPYACCTGNGTGTCDTDLVECAFFPLPVSAGKDAIVAADLHLGRHYWQGQDTLGTNNDDCTSGTDTPNVGDTPAPYACCTGAGTGTCEADDSPDLYVVSGPNPDLTAVSGSPVVLSFPTEIRSGLTYTVGNNRDMGDIFRDNWYVRTREATTAETASMNAWVFVSDSSDRGTAAGIGALTLTAPVTADAGDTTVFHFGHFFFGPDMLERGETYNDWLFVTSQADPLTPMGSVVLP